MLNSLRRLKVPLSAKKDEIITIKTMAEHEMEPGVRRDPITGVIYPRLIIQKVIVRYNGKIVFSCNWFSGVSANPFMSFKIKAVTSGLIEVEWIDDYSKSTRLSKVLKVIDSEGKEVLPIFTSLKEKV